MSETTSKSPSTGIDPDLSRDAREAARLLLWARANRFALSRVKIGEVEIEIAADLTATPTAPSLASATSDDDPYTTYGGEALKRHLAQEAAGAATASALVEEDDDEDEEPKPA